VSGATPIVLDARVVEHLEKLAAQMGDRKVNGYYCDTCKGTLLVEHVDEGVTPMFLGCRATSGCRGMSRSLGYPPPPVPADLGEPTHEWYRPLQDEFDGLAGAMRDHVLEGGLMLRPKRAS
jgi:hypothetical protein